MSNGERKFRKGWIAKFKGASAGIGDGIRGQSSFLVHVTFAIAVVVIAAILKVTLVEWCLLVICVALVFALELFNSSLELLAKAITNEFNESIRKSLNIASGAVLVGAIGASIVGIIVLLNRFLIFID